MSSEDDSSKESNSDCSDYSDTPEIRGRKNIRAIKSFAQLVQATKCAYLEESSRKLRLAAHERQLKTFFPNNEYKEKGILDFDLETKRPTVCIHDYFLKILKAHQKEGIRFMWNACCETIRTIDAGKGAGCILAHCMGLGKTLQVITFVHTLLTNSNLKFSKIFILCPKNTLLNWVNEFQMWIQAPLAKIGVYNANDQADRGIGVIMQWAKSGGVLIMSYNAFRLLIEGLPKSGPRPIYDALINPGADLVICDEGHILKNSETRLSKVMFEIKTPRRVILTGTPLQNNLVEYFCMVNFVRPHLLGSKSEFKNMFVHPIQNGQYEDSLRKDVELMKARSHVLHRTLTACVQRYDYTTLKEFLPDKLEFVLNVRLTPEQVVLYEHYLSSFNDKLPWKKRAKGLFADYQLLQRVWTHPYSLKLYDERPAPPAKKKGRKDDDDGAESEEDEWNVVRPKKWKPGWWQPYLPKEHIEAVEASAKLLVLFEIIEQCEARGEKLLVFSGSLFSLTMIEHFLLKPKSGGTTRWIPGNDYLVLSGATSTLERDEMCKTFNDPANCETRLFMISTKAGGLGITLNAANRAVIFDASWNPSHDIQSIFRIYRLGQDKPCFVYRLVASGTMEEKIYERQVTKQSTSHRVVDEKQIQRHYTATELQELYELTPDRFYDNDPNIPRKDSVLKSIIDKYGDLVGGYHEHDSLLRHKAEEELKDADKISAWSLFNDGNADLETDHAVVAMMEPSTFRLENFKIVLRQHFSDLPEGSINMLSQQLLPKIRSIMHQSDFKDLMLQEALKARYTEARGTNDDDDGLDTPPMKARGLRRGKPYLSKAKATPSLPQAIRHWGHLGTEAFGSPDVTTDDD